jgi:hypothetical protein
MKPLDSDPEFTVGAIPTETDDPPRGASTRGRSRAPVVAACAMLGLIIGAAAFHFLGPRSASLAQQALPAPPAQVPAPVTPPESAIQHPVGTLAAGETGGVQFPVPPLDESDVVVNDAIETILNGGAFRRLMVPDQIVRHIVATIDNLPRKTIAAQIVPTRPTPGSLATASTAGGLAISDANAGRYVAYVNAFEAIDTQRLAGFYVRLYPLFQQAYVELGYPDGYFNDRLIGVIDHLLSAPEPRRRIYVAQPKVLFEFTDPELEALSSGQKILVRIGIDNEMRVKAKLRDIRKALTATNANR